MITDPFESGKKAGERSASDYDQRAKSIYEIEIHGRKRIETIYSRLKPRFDDIAFHIYNTGTSIMISTPLGEGYPELSIAIEGEYVGGRYVHNSDRYLVSRLLKNPGIRHFAPMSDHLAHYRGRRH